MEEESLGNQESSQHEDRGRARPSEQWNPSIRMFMKLHSAPGNHSGPLGDGRLHGRELIQM
jgi:hypothetical protein